MSNEKNALRKEVLKVINAQIVASHKLNSDPSNFVINQNSLCDALVDLLTTVRQSERQATFRAAAGIARMMAAGETYENR